MEASPIKGLKLDGRLDFTPYPWMAVESLEMAVEALERVMILWGETVIFGESSVVSDAVDDWYLMDGDRMYECEK